MSDGGSIEIFASASDAESHYAYVKSGFAERDYLCGTVLQRLSTAPTTDQANKYVSTIGEC